MMGRKEKLKWDEWKGVHARHIYCFTERAGVSKKMKRNIHKRSRGRKREGLFDILMGRKDFYCW